MSNGTNEADAAFCPASTPRALFIGRTQYTLGMFDERTRTRRWNGSFTDYSAHALPVDVDYARAHLAVCSDGRLTTVDRRTGAALWARRFTSPVVAVYVLQATGLHRLPLAVVAAATADRLTNDAGDDEAERGGGVIGDDREWVRQLLEENVEQGSRHRRTLYVGETEHGLYALPSLVDVHTVLINGGRDGQHGPPLLDGPRPIAEGQQFGDSSNNPTIHVDLDLATLVHRTNVGELLLLGHHETPTAIEHRLIAQHSPGSPTRRLQEIAYYDEAAKIQAAKVIPPPTPITLESLLYNFWLAHRAAIVIVAVTALTGTVGVVWLCCTAVQKAALSTPTTSKTASNGTRQRNSRSIWSWIPSPITGGDIVQDELTPTDVPPDWEQVGAVMFDPQAVLGRGCEGTVVYR